MTYESYLEYVLPACLLSASASTVSVAGTQGHPNSTGLRELAANLLRGNIRIPPPPLARQPPPHPPPRPPLHGPQRLLIFQSSHSNDLLSTASSTSTLISPSQLRNLSAPSLETIAEGDSFGSVPGGSKSRSTTVSIVIATKTKIATITTTTTTANINIVTKG
jgi:hypothetical protein